jgi:hypothetical protein
VFYSDKMVNESGEAWYVQTRRPLTVLQRIWFAAALLTGFVYIAFIPPFESGDELTHWNRLWSVAEGEVVCRTMPMAAKIIPNFFRFPIKRLLPGFPSATESGDPSHPKVGAQDFRRAWDFTGPADLGASGDIECVYPPTGYVLPAIAARLVGLRLDGTPRRGGMLTAFYATRVVNWLLTSIAMFWLLRAMFWGRSVLLIFFSLPEVLQQGTSLNNDAFLFAMTFLILGRMLRPALWSNVAWIAAALMAMTTIKPVYAPMALLTAPLLLFLWAKCSSFRWQQVLIILGLVTPYFFWKLWSVLNNYDRTNDWHPTWINPLDQAAFLRQHPLHFFVICWSQFKNFFGDGMLSGSWKSVVGLFGWTSFYMAPVGYYFVLAALAFALAADITNGIDAPSIGSPVGTTRALRNLCWILAASSMFLVLAAITLAMYLQFTPVGSNEAMTEGRYFLIPFLLLVAIGLYGVKLRWGVQLVDLRLSLGAIVLSAALMAASNALALEAIRDHFY